MFFTDEQSAGVRSQPLARVVSSRLTDCVQAPLALADLVKRANE